ncbi:putative glutamine ABC transporter permease protein glnM [Chlamydiales bacterium STE3]|nr:putative glutamine ABC transporter permease protein glnM [Chlamydiales bacterium STE3]
MKKLLSVIQIFIALLLFSWFCHLIFINQLYNWSAVWQYRDLFFTGWCTTVVISAASLILSTLIGLSTALLRRSNIPLLRFLSITYTELIRGTPLLVQILIFYYVIAHAMGLENRFVVGIITLSLFSGAYIAEIIRAGIESVGKTQIESAKAICLTPLQTYLYVIFPQAFKQSLPPLTGQFASIIKDSSLLSIIGINELTNSAQQINSATYSTLESFLPLAFGYLILTLPISILSKKLEKRHRYET